jgi:hypothetical protein
MSILFDLTFGNIPLLLFAIMAVITVLAVVRTLIKMKKKRAINVTPVGVFNDLPESVTGMSKSKEWEIKEEQNEQ